METVLDKKASTEGTIKITLKPEDYQSKWNEKLKEHGKKANIKGFRPGKAPFGLLKKFYGKAVLVEEINQILSASLQDYIKEQNLRILGEPLPVEESNEINWDEPGDFTFSYEIGWVEPFDVALSENISIDNYKIEVDDKDLNTTIDNILAQNGETVHGDSVGEMDDVDLEIEAAGKTYKKHIHLSKLDADKKAIFLGKKEGDVVEFDPITVLGVESAQAWLKTEEAIEGNLSAKVQHFHGKKPAELTPEFMDKIIGPGKASNEEEFRAEVKRIMESNYAQEAEGFASNQLREKLVEATNFEIPKNFLIKWLAQRNEKTSVAEIEQEFPQHEKGIRWELILNRISEQYDIKVEHEEILTKTKQLLLGQIGLDSSRPEIEDSLNNWANNYLKGENGENYSQMWERVRFDKVMNFARTKVKLEDKTATWEEFQTKIVR